MKKKTAKILEKEIYSFEGEQELEERKFKDRLRAFNDEIARYKNFIKMLEEDKQKIILAWDGELKDD